MSRRTMSVTTTGLQLRTGSRAVREAVELLSSMRFAISLLTVICIASVIGTVLKQHEPVNNYVNQFGPFWAERVRHGRAQRGLQRLVVPADPGLPGARTSLCIARNTPKILPTCRPTRSTCASRACRPSTTGPGRARRDAATQALRAHRRRCCRGTAGRRKRRRRATTAGWSRPSKGARQQARLPRGAQRHRADLPRRPARRRPDRARADVRCGGKTPYTGGGMIARRAGRSTACRQRNPTFRGNLLVPEGTQRRHRDPEPVRRRAAAGPAVRRSS